MALFNIHDWQASQRLNEGYSSANKLYFVVYDDGNTKKFLEGPLGGGMYGPIHRTLEKAKEEASKRNKSAQTNNYYVSDHKMNAIKEHHGDDEFPGKDMTAFDLLDKLKSDNIDLYNQLEDYMKKMDEASQMGTGTSFNAGSGEGYATPKAFSKKGKWKNKEYKYQQ